LPLALFFLPLAIYNCDLPLRYASWKNLSKAELIEEADVYLKNYTNGGQACLYAVDCRSGRAELVLVKDLETWDIEKTKDIVWRRRFSSFCPGRTANFGLHVIPANEQDEPPVQSIETARWSFYHDRFLPRYGRFQGGSFSEADWEKCSEPYAVAARAAREAIAID
jgi:hypothetical protein